MEQALINGGMCGLQQYKNRQKERTGNLYRIEKRRESFHHFTYGTTCVTAGGTLFLYKNLNEETYYLSIENFLESCKRDNSFHTTKNSVSLFWYQKLIISPISVFLIFSTTNTTVNIFEWVNY
jgi:hypothetical protein